MENTEFGGVILGLIGSYQDVLTPLDVKMLPNKKTNITIKKLFNISLKFIFVIYLFYFYCFKYFSSLHKHV